MPAHRRLRLYAEGVRQRRSARLRQHPEIHRGNVRHTRRRPWICRRPRHHRSIRLLRFQAHAANLWGRSGTFGCGFFHPRHETCGAARYGLSLRRRGSEASSAAPRDGATRPQRVRADLRVSPLNSRRRPHGAENSTGAGSTARRPRDAEGTSDEEALRRTPTCGGDSRNSNSPRTCET